MNSQILDINTVPRDDSSAWFRERNDDGIDSRSVT
jgi:hypothetical protein